MNSIEKFYSDYTKSVEFYEDSLKTQITRVFQDWLDDNRISQKKAAEKIGIKPAALSRLLTGSTNMTMNSAAKLLWAADYLPVLCESRKYYGTAHGKYSLAPKVAAESFTEKIPAKEEDYTSIAA